MKRVALAVMPVRHFPSAFAPPSALRAFPHRSVLPTTSRFRPPRCTLSSPPPFSFTPPQPPRSIHPKKSLSQNFLRDKQVIDRIITSFRNVVQETDPSPTVVEVGPGLGALTDRLIEQYPNMHAVEIDKRAVQHLHARHAHLNLHHADVLQLDWNALSTQLSTPLAVIGNLPYNIVSQILFSLLEAPDNTISAALVMMQKEVAQRVTAKPNCRAYGILSVVSQLYAQPQILFSVPNTAFFPVPEVTSAMVQLRFIPHPQFDTTNVPMNRALRTVVKTAFNQRRKRLRNALKTICNGKELPNGWDLKRPEELEPIQFLEITQFLYPNGLKEDGKGKASRSVWR
ncbi:Ribosomal RNA adenine dimethylase [Gracilaria domingensis]|nr:Ribosomal RNA adenine dimethylase [Gracilaria domingensis]